MPVMKAESSFVIHRTKGELYWHFFQEEALWIEYILKKKKKLLYIYWPLYGLLDEMISYFEHACSAITISFFHSRYKYFQFCFARYVYIEV